MKISSILLKTFDRVILGIETPKDILFKIFFLIKSPFSDRKRWNLYEKYLENKIIKKNLREGVLRYRDIRLPDFSNNERYVKSFIPTYYDILFFYDRRKDIYDSKSIDMYERSFATEGTYCYQDEKSQILVKRGDTVIDAGAWIGLFSAYASKKGARVYAFEPSLENRAYLNETARLNRNIEVVPLALHSKTETLNFMEDKIASRIEPCDAKSNTAVVTHKVEAISLDDFVDKNKIKVDFIKADIEGNERNMLLGATKILKKFTPKLSICTYHLPDDKEVLAKIIMAANPQYKIIQRKMKLYAYV